MESGKCLRWPPGLPCRPNVGVRRLHVSCCNFPQPVFPACQPSQKLSASGLASPPKLCWRQDWHGPAAGRGLLKLGRGSFGAWQLTIGVGFPGSSHHCAGVAFFPSITGLWLSQKVSRCWPLIVQWEGPFVLLPACSQQSGLSCWQPMALHPSWLFLCRRLSSCQSVKPFASVMLRALPWNIQPQELFPTKDRAVDL
ncbi:hypothetical protein lerEdw1_005470 [Lerista edwardsae]|nr:hypothetical protein lerEdw1_005470 [Lerista edwardsae]